MTDAKANNQPGGRPEGVAERKAVLTVLELQHFLRISKPTALTAIREGTVPSIRLGRRILIPRAALDRFLADAGTPTATGGTVTRSSGMSP